MSGPRWLIMACLAILWLVNGAEISSAAGRGIGWVATLGYGRLETSTLASGDSGDGGESNAEFEVLLDTWKAYTFGGGFCWGEGRGQLLIEVLLTNNQRLESTGLGITNLGRTVTWHGERTCYGVDLRFRHLILPRVFAGGGVGFVGITSTAVPDDPDVGGLSLEDETHPDLSLELDVEVLRTSGYVLLIGVQKHVIPGSSVKDSPNWNRIELSSTLVGILR